MFKTTTVPFRSQQCWRQSGGSDWIPSLFSSLVGIKRYEGFFPRSHTWYWVLELYQWRCIQLEETGNTYSKAYPKITECIVSYNSNSRAGPGQAQPRATLVLFNCQMSTLDLGFIFNAVHMPGHWSCGIMVMMMMLTKWFLSVLLQINIISFNYGLEVIFFAITFNHITSMFNQGSNKLPGKYMWILTGLNLGIWPKHWIRITMIDYGFKIHL